MMKSIKYLAVSFLLIATIATVGYAQQWSSWSKWKQSECYEGIWTRHRSQPSSIKGKQKVQVEVRNSYKHGISVSTRLTNDPSEQTIYRIEIPAGETYSSGSTESFLLLDKSFYFLHDKVRFEGDKYGDKYRSCDRVR